MIFFVIARVTLRALVSRRRTVLMLLLAGVPILLGLLVRANTDGIGQVGATVGRRLSPLALRAVIVVVGLVALAVFLLR